MTDEVFTPTPAAEYPTVKTIDLEMPSGAKVRVRPPSIFYMMEHGQVPARIIKLVARQDNPKAEPLSEQEMYILLDFMLAASYVDPLVSTARKKGCVYLHDIPDGDRVTVIEALELRKAV